MQFTTGMIALAAALFSAASANPVLDVSAEPISAPELVERQSAHPSYASDAEFKRIMLGGHDAYRRQHGINTPMTWNSARATAANNYAKTCNFAHTGTSGVGENLAIGYGDAAKVITAWALERQKYNYNSPGFSSATGHFTQVVWKKTGSIGCGRASCGSRGYIVVCQYVAQGNVLPASNFATNVPRQVRGRITDPYTYKPASKVKRDAEAEAEAEPEVKVKRNANAQAEIPLVAPIKIAGVEE